MTLSTISPATSFAADFLATEDDWRRAAEAALKGRPLEGLIAHRSVDGHMVDAIAPRRAAQPIAGRPAGARWTAMTRIDLGDPAAANAQAIEDLNNGASGLSIVFRAPGDGTGVVADTLDRLERTLDGVMLDLAPIHLDIVPYEGRMSASLLAALVERRGLPPGDLQILFGLDLLRDLSRTGTLPKPWSEIRKRFAGVLAGLRARGFRSPIAMPDGRVPHCAGASAAQELAGTLASATEHVRAMVDNGIDLEAAADTMSFAYACDVDQFATIAKFRAARLLWAAWRREAGLPDQPAHIHAETSRRMMTQRDPQTNMVRTTIAAFAAGVGGADSIVVLPHTFALGGSDWDARRIARNAQAIVIEETNAHRVADPAAGAGAIELLTDRLAEAAWDLFRGIERDGGMFNVLASGSWQASIVETRDARAQLVATRKAPIVGVSEFPRADETPISMSRDEGPAPAEASRPLDAPLAEDAESFDRMTRAFLAGASFADIRLASRPSPQMSATPLDLDRLAGPFEALRAANESEPATAKAFLALLGPIARHSARAGFVRNLFTSGGFQTIDGPIDADPAQVADAFGRSGARLAVVCGSDESYAEQGEAVVAALRELPSTIWVAGKPDNRTALQEAGATRFLAAGENALATLRQAALAVSAGAQPATGAAS